MVTPHGYAKFGYAGYAKRIYGMWLMDACYAKHGYTTWLCYNGYAGYAEFGYAIYGYVGYANIKHIYGMELVLC